MSKGIAISADEKQWKIERDANTVREYADLIDDPKRMAAAQQKLRDDMKNTEKVLVSVSRGVGATGDEAKAKRDGAQRRNKNSTAGAGSKPQPKPVGKTKKAPPSANAPQKPTKQAAKPAPKPAGKNALRDAFLGRKVGR